MKRILTFSLTLMMIFSLAVFGEAQLTVAQDTSDDGPSVLDFPDQGIQIQLEGDWLELRDNILTTPVYAPTPDSVSGLMVNFGNDEDMAEAKSLTGKKSEEALWRNAKRLFTIAYIKTENDDIETVRDLVGGPDKEATVTKLAVSGDTTFYFCSYPKNTQDLSDTSKDKYERLFKGVESMKDKIITSGPADRPSISSGTQVEFTSTDLDGNTISGDIFKEHKLTMVNMWATFCNPCIEELPTLQKVSDEMKDQDVAVVGVLGDAADIEGEADADTIDLGKAILKKQKVSYLNLVMNDELQKALPTDAFPVTVFVDSEGKVVGKSIRGAMDEDEYKQAIQEALDSLAQ